MPQPRSLVLLFLIALPLAACRATAAPFACTDPIACGPIAEMQDGVPHKASVAWET
jgi:NhaP-type Na+/H+ or K+/H+ antiporter